MNHMNMNPDQIKQITHSNNLTEQQKLVRKYFEFLCDGNNQAAFHLIFLKANYKEWAKMYQYVYRNKIIGQKLVDLFANESADGGGTHSGATFLLSRVKGYKHTVENIKIDELI